MIHNVCSMSACGIVLLVAHVNGKLLRIMPRFTNR